MKIYSFKNYGGVMFRMRIAYGLILLMIPVFSLAGCRNNKVDSKVQVVASIGPLGNFVKKVGGERVSVEILISPGSNPHTYEPSPQQILAISRAKLLVIIGTNLEFWKDKILDSVDNKELVVLELSSLVTLVKDREEGYNPHIWLSPKIVMKSILSIRDRLSDIDPKARDYYHNRTDKYIEELRALDAEIEKKVRSFQTKKFISHHPAWIYFANDYGLTQVAVIESTPGREPSPQELVRIIENAKKEGAKAIFAEQQLSPKVSQVIAEECNCKVLLLDILGKPPEYDYIAFMKSNLKILEEGMKY